MINLKFKATGQKLVRDDVKTIAAFAREQLYAEFTLGEGWADISPVTAQFKNGDKVYDVFVENNMCKVPWEVVEDRGILEVCLIGGNLLTTNTVSINVLSSGVIGGLIPTVASPTVYSHIMDLADSIDKRVNEIAEECENNFDSFAEEINNKVGQIAQGDFSDKEVMVGTLYFRKNSNEDYASVEMGSEAGIRILNNLDKNSDWFIKIGSGDPKNEVDNGIQFESTGEFIVKNNGGDIIRLTQKGGTDNVIKGNETLKIFGGEGSVSFDTEDAGITYKKADWTDNFKQLNINSDKGVNIQAKNNSYFQSGEKKLVIGNDFNSVEFRTDGVAKFKNAVNAVDLQINGTSLKTMIAEAVNNAMAEINAEIAEINEMSWSKIQDIVRAGLGTKYFPVGSQLKCNHSEYGEIIWDVVAHNYNVDPSGESRYSMTLLTHSIIDSLQFDEAEALYYCENGLQPGTYSFKIQEGYYEDYGGGKQYQFTLENQVPSGGVIVFPWLREVQAADTAISAYSSPEAAEAIETVNVTEGSEGTYLGITTDTAPDSNCNQVHRIRSGSGNWKESALRQWLNSDESAGNIWQPQTHFDRPPSWANSKNGFMNGLDREFVNAVGEVENITITSDTFEYDGNKHSSYTTSDKFWLPSEAEILNQSQNSDIYDGAQFKYFENNDAVKYDLSETAKTYTLRTPHTKSGCFVRMITAAGTAEHTLASGNTNIAVACAIY